MTAVVEGPQIAERSLGEWRRIALHQAEELARQAELIQHLIRERDTEKSNLEAAYDLAEQYATAAGVVVSRDQALEYVEQYWASRGKFERKLTELGTFHWDMFLLSNELRDAVMDGRASGTSGVDLARKIAARMSALNPFTGRTNPKDPLFAQPGAPQSALFEVAPSPSQGGGTDG